LIEYVAKKQIHVVYTLPVLQFFHCHWNKPNLPNNKSIITSINFNRLHHRYKNYPRYWIDWSAILITSTEPSSIKLVAVSFPALIVSSLHIGSPNCINIGDRNILPDCALRLTEMFSNRFEYVISNPEKPLQEIITIRYCWERLISSLKSITFIHKYLCMVQIHTRI